MGRYPWLYFYGLRIELAELIMYLHFIRFSAWKKKIPPDLIRISSFEYCRLWYFIKVSGSSALMSRVQRLKRIRRIDFEPKRQESAGCRF